MIHHGCAHEEEKFASNLVTLDLIARARRVIAELSYYCRNDSAEYNGRERASGSILIKKGEREREKREAEKRKRRKAREGERERIAFQQ